MTRLIRLSFAFLPIAPATACAAGAPVNPRLTGTPFLTKWDAEDYGGAPINYHVVQHPVTGFIYVGNNHGLLEFDGAAWRLIRLRDESEDSLGAVNQTVVPIAVVDARGAVWLGSSNAVAVLRPDARGELQAVEVTDRLPEAERNFGRLYLGAAAPHGVYLAGPSRLLFFGADGTARSWRAGPTNFNGLCWHDGALHASAGAAGLLRLERDALVPVAAAPRSPNPAIPDTLRLLAAQAAPSGRGAIFLTNVGPLRWADRGASLEPFSVECTQEFARESATAAAFLPDGRLAFSFPRRGLLILEAGGQVSALLHQTHGLPGSRVDHLATDNQGGLWLARLNGLARLQLDSRFAVQGTFDAPREILRHGDRLYVAHYQGLAWRDDATGAFHPVADLPGGLRTLLGIGERLFGTGQYLYEITRENRAVVALPISFNGLVPIRRAPGHFAGASVAGLRLLRFDGDAWHDQGLVSSVTGSVRAVLDDRDGWLWALGYLGGGAWRLDFRTGASPTAPAEFLEEARVLPRGQDPPFPGLDAERQARRAQALPAHDWAAPAPVSGRNLASPAAYLEQWWLLKSSPPQFIRRDVGAAEDRWRTEFVRTGPLRNLVPITLYPDAATRTLWCGGQGALISIDPAWIPAQPPAPLRVVVRRLNTVWGELLWANAAAAASVDLQSFPFDSLHNSIRFSFSAPTFLPEHRGASRTVYRTRLAGLEDDWSPWSRTPWREFTDLPYRKFVFHVQARDLNDRESPAATLTFTIAPPWWLARPALAGYVGLTLLGLAGLVRLRTRALRRRNEQLESLVAARTAELERLRRLEMDEKISARLAEEKARLEVLRYQLNPHFLFNSLNSIYTLVWTHSRPAGDLVRRLAEFCRMTLTRGGNETATLAEEFSMLRAYLDLEQIRWEKNLKVEITLAPEVEAVRLPPFLLLPLVENAVKYGGHTSPDLLRIRVVAGRGDRNEVLIEVANSGTWVEPGSVPAVASTNIGLENLRQRLARHYPGTHEFTTEAKDGWVVMRLRLSPGAGA